MNNYRTNCNPRHTMPGSAPSMSCMKNSCVQRTEPMQSNACSRNAMPSYQNTCEKKDSMGYQNINCGCNETQPNQSCGCSCPEIVPNPGCNSVCPEIQQNNCCTCNEVQNNPGCGCESIASACRPEPTLNEFPIGMAYVPIQQWRRLYDKCAAFRHGTLFQELNLDFLGRRCN